MKKIRILIIEDNNDIRESTAEILMLGNYEVFQAENGKNGVELATQYLPDVILCDIMMPELDGYGVLHLLGKKTETAAIPFVFLTAKTERIDIRKGMEMGADDYLTKPFDDVELLNAIETRLKKRELQKSLYSESLDKLDNLLNNNKGLEELTKVISERKVRQIKKRQVIYYEGDTVNGIYLVITGRVKTFKVANDGRELLTGIYKPDEYFGVAALLANENYHETSEAMEDTSLCLLPKDLLEPLLNKYPSVASRFIKLLANNVLDKEEQLIQLAYHSVRKRMADVLIRLISNQELTSGASLLTISRDNLAAMAGMATETVSRILSDFKDEELIERKGSQILILDHSRLQNMKN
ncbi:transcriptional regulator [Pedobacter ginsengisoli]|uniref:Transcriptional regulator n=1 Tax=Pedobacter ginsengisoli TaxID=363852 RepID=A0A2D1U3C5_9SPHI|nr:response regulator [Pedobacter ginsengisoli]ATP56117.1 transcriptional regulator [Pedobacter ginsengisoli]